MSNYEDTLRKNYINCLASLMINELNIKGGGGSQRLLEEKEDLEDKQSTMQTLMGVADMPINSRTYKASAYQLVLSKTGYSIEEVSKILAGKTTKAVEQTDKLLKITPKRSVNKQVSQWEFMMQDYVQFCKRGLKIGYRPGLNPEFPDGGAGSFVINEHQYRVIAVMIDRWISGKPVRAQILKARQMGITTALLAFFLWMMVHTPGFKVIFLIDVNKHMFTKRQLVVTWLEELSAGFDEAPSIVVNKTGIILLSNKSFIMFDSSEGVNPGTSEFVHAVYFSEQAKWNSKKVELITTSLIPGLPNVAGTFMVNESTAHGLEAFYESWQRLKSGEEVGATKTDAIFIAWYMSGEYTTKPPHACFNIDGEFIYANDDKEIAEKDSSGSIVRNEEMLATRYGLTDGQVYWRRLQIKNSFKGDIRKFDQEYPTTDEHAFSGSGQLYFGADLVKEIKRLVGEPLFTCTIRDEAGKEDASKIHNYTEYRPAIVKSPLGEVRVYNLPVPGRKYVLGGDVAEGKQIIKKGKTEPDSSTAVVLDEETGEVCLIFEDRLKPEWFMFKVLLIGIFYNLAKVNVERNSVGESVWGFFKQTGYPMVHLRDSEGSYEDTAWEKLNQFNRETFLTDLSVFVRRNPALIKDRQLILEISKFVINVKGKPEAMSGYHDDLVLALMHAYLQIYQTKGVRYIKPDEVIVEEPIDSFGRLMDDLNLEEREPPWGWM